MIKLREPLRTLVGRYEAGLSRDGTHSRTTVTWMCNAIEGFFEDHPRVKHPSQVLITDVEDWKLMKLERYAWNTVRTQLCAIKAFYSWLRNHEELQIDDPVVVPPPRPRQPASVAPQMSQAVPSDAYHEPNTI